MFKHSKLTWFLALCLILGSGFGLLLFAVLVPAKIKEGAYDAVAIFVVLAFLFALSLYVGYRFFRGSVRAYRWALGLFISQIPVIAWGPVEMRWFTGVEFPVVLNGIQENLLSLTYHANVGAEASFVFGGSVEETALGINVFALFATIVLLRARSAARGDGAGMEVSASS